MKARATTKMKHITQKVQINGDAMHLNLKIQIDGKEVCNQRAHSLTLPFLTLLGNCFNEGPIFKASGDNQVIDDKFGIWGLYFDENANPDRNDDIQAMGAAITSWSGSDVTVDTSGMAADEIPYIKQALHIIIRGTTATSGHVNEGVYEVSAVDDATADELTFTLTEALPDDTAATNASFYGLALLNGQNFLADPFEIMDIRIGASNTAVEIDDVITWQDLRADFTNPGLTVDTPVIATSSSKISITKAFTNDSGSNKTVREICLLSRMFDANESDNTIARGGGTIPETWEGFAVPLARDVIADKVVADQETITITYEFTVSEDGAKGILATFNELMYRQMAQTDRTVQDWYNNNQTDGASSNQFALYGGAEDFGDHELSLSGIQAGSHTGSIDIDDVDMNDGAGNKTRIMHGEEDGNLYYFGSRVKGYGIVDANNAFLDVVGIFENRGSTSVDVNEVGFNVFSNHSLDIYPVCIARHVLDAGDRQTLAAGDYLQVTYRFTISTS